MQFCYCFVPESLSHEEEKKKKRKKEKAKEEEKNYQVRLKMQLRQISIVQIFVSGLNISAGDLLLLKDKIIHIYYRSHIMAVICVLESLSSLPISDPRGDPSRGPIKYHLLTYP